MEFNVTRKTLKEVVTKSIRGKSTSASVLSAWTVSASNGKAHFSRFFIREHVDASIDIVGQVSVDGTSKFIADHNKIVLALKIGKEKTVTIDTEKKTIDGIDISSEHAADKLPELNWNGERKFAFSVKEEEFAALEKRAFPHVSDDETRYFMTGVMFEAKQADGFPDGVSWINIAATNGRTLYAQDKVYAASGSGSAIIPAYAFSRPKNTDHIVVQLYNRADANKEFVTVESVGADFLIRKYTECIDGQFPQYRRVIPAETAPNFKASTKEFRDAVTAAATLASNKTRRIVLRVSNGTGSVYAHGEGSTASKEYEFKCTLMRDDIALAFNADYLLYCMPGSDDVEIRFDDPMKAITVQNSGIAIIMPMQLE